MVGHSVLAARVFTLSLSCKRAKCIFFLSNRLLTLCQKQPGCTYIILYPEVSSREANLERRVLFYPERFQRGVPSTATHLLTSQQLPHSLQCAHRAVRLTCRLLHSGLCRRLLGF